MRSVNGQVEFLMKQTVHQRGPGDPGENSENASRDAES